MVRKMFPASRGIQKLSSTSLVRIVALTLVRPPTYFKDVLRAAASSDRGQKRPSKDLLDRWAGGYGGGEWHEEGPQSLTGAQPIEQSAR